MKRLLQKNWFSHSTYQIIKDNFECTHRGQIEARNKGMVDMYFVEKENS